MSYDMDDYLRIKRVIGRVVSVFETGTTPGAKAVGTAAVLPDGAGFSVGIHQATDRHDMADQVVMEYISAGGAHAEEFRAFLPRLVEDESTKLDPKNLPKWALDFIALFKRAGFDPIMWRAQEAVFDRLVWTPVESLCESIGVILPLTRLIVYDMAVHSGLGGVAKNRARFKARPPSGHGDEKAWAEAFNDARAQWLSRFVDSKNRRRQDLIRGTVYRTTALDELISANNWDLVAPFTVRGVEVRDGE